MDYKLTGAFISNLRKTEKSTQKEFAKKFHVTHQAVSKWENGIALPDTETLISMANSYNIKVDDILNAKTECSPDIKYPPPWSRGKSLNRIPNTRSFISPILLETIPANYKILLFLSLLLLFPFFLLHSKKAKRAGMPDFPWIFLLFNFRSVAWSGLKWVKKQT